MNQTGCPEGWATDTIVWFDNPNKCDMKVSSWIIIGVLGSGARLLLSFGHYYLWARRESKQKNNEKYSKKQDLVFGKKLPLVPILSIAQTVPMTVFFVLTGTDIANGPNGVAMFLYGLLYVMSGISNILFYSKFVRLGYKLVGKNSKWISATEKQHLSTFGFRGKIALILSLIAGIGSIVTFCVFGFIFSNQIVILVIGDAFIGAFILFVSAGQIYHIQRVKNAITNVIDSAVSKDSPGSKNDLRLVHRKLFEQQLAVLCIATIFVLLAFLVCARILMPNYYVLMLTVWGDTLANSLVLLSNFRYLFLRYRERVSDTKSSDDAQNLGEGGNNGSSLHLAFSQPSES